MQLLRQLFLVVHLPMDRGVAAHAFCRAVKRQGGADRDIETLGESIHRYLDVGVSAVDGLLGESGKFGAEDQCHGLADIEVANHGVVLVG